VQEQKQTPVNHSIILGINLLGTTWQAIWRVAEQAPT